jgi:integrase
MTPSHRTNACNPQKFKSILNFIIPTFGTGKIKQGMRKPKITLANDEHRNRGVVNLHKKHCFIKELLGHESSKTTEIYTHVSQKDFANFKNPLDELL